ncbi:MAG: hypothetical protein Kow00114_32850 [Kiloniellaceae bacterium]
MQGVAWPDMTLQEAEAALAEIREAMAPAARRAVVELLFRLWHATAKAGMGEEDLEAKASIYAEDLAGYPADVTRKVLTEARRRFKFFPAVAELVAGCEVLASRRRWLLCSLEDRLAQLQRPALPVRPAMPKMPGSGRTAKAGFWSVDGGANVEKLARLKSITYRQARALLVYASPAELLELEELVRAGDGAPAPAAN